MLSSSSGKEYDIVLGELLSKASEYINQKNKTRNYYHSLIIMNNLDIQYC